MTYDEFNLAFSFEERAGFVLSDLQKQDIMTLIDWKRSLCRYDVGGGKTVVSTVVSLMLNRQTTLVTVPPILLLPWERWLNRVSENVLRYQGTPPERKKMTLADKRWVVVSHAIFRRDFERIIAELAGNTCDIIVDEAQAIKSPDAILYTKVGTFARKRCLQMLSGTPISTPLDCYTFIRLTTPEVYRSYAAFESSHVAETDFFKKPIKFQGLELLSERFAARSIKRTKEELHGYDNTPLYPDTEYDLEPEHLALYNRLLEEQLLILDDGAKIDATTSQRMYHAMQQIVVNFDYYSGDSKNRSAAYDLIDMTIEQTDCLNPSKSKLIIWTYYKLTSRSVLKYLVSKGIYAVGAYSEVNSERNFELFMNDPLCRIGVFQPGSAGAGLNPQEVCSEALFIETSTIPMQNRQSIGRVDRVGQWRKPVIRFGVARGTVQASLLERLLYNDELVSTVEQTKTSLRALLRGEVSAHSLSSVEIAARLSHTPEVSSYQHSEVSDSVDSLQLFVENPPPDADF